MPKQELKKDDLEAVLEEGTEVIENDEAEGDFLHHEYAFRRSAGTIARVSKKWFSFRDTYGVEIAADQDDILILAATVVIDMACHERRD